MAGYDGIERMRCDNMQLTDIFAEGSQYREQVYALYEEAFPEEEKKPLSLMEALTAEGKTKMPLLTITKLFLP